jgi:hypothetical protein
MVTGIIGITFFLAWQTDADLKKMEIHFILRAVTEMYWKMIH